MDLVAMARAMGRALQQDERYLAMMVARQQNDEDAELQELIGDFNLRRINLNQALEAESAEAQAMEQGVREAYSKLMNQPSMRRYNEARQQVESMLREITTVLSASANGEDPDTVDPSACDGDCSGCAGCH